MSNHLHVFEKHFIKFVMDLNYCMMHNGEEARVHKSKNPIFHFKKAIKSYQFISYYKNHLYKKTGTDI